MALGLDLSAARGKAARALEHLDALDSELKSWSVANPSYKFRFSLVDPVTGWCSLILVPTNVSEPRFGIIFGDVVHNLRSALDYIVMALVEASGAPLSSRHQFPVFIDQQKYKRDVGPASRPSDNGPLAGLTYGAGLIEQVQPYHRLPEPRSDQLWGVYRFSNADKHRQIATRLAIPNPDQPVDITYKGTMVEKVDIEEVSKWVPEEECELAHLRFDPPVATNLKVGGKMSMAMMFVTDRFGEDPDPLAIEMGSLRKTCEYVGTIVDQFGTL